MSQSLIFVMGVQRSGTNALFRSLKVGAACAYNEANHNPVFKNMYLRSEEEVRKAVLDVQGPVLLKPISETKRRSLLDVFAEYQDHDLRVVWVYRDPVNCYASHIERWTEYRNKPDEFVASWCARNAMVLELNEVQHSRVAVVRYADLISDPTLVKRLGEFVGIRGRYRFRADSDRGRKVLDTGTVTTLTEGTADRLVELDELRRFTPKIKRTWQQRIARFT